MRRLDDKARELMSAANATGAIEIHEVATGAVVVATGVERDVAAPVLPLSVIKLYAAAVWWNHETSDGAFPHPKRGTLTVTDALVDGYDLPGEQMAVALRAKLGARAVLDELRALGLRSLTLEPDATDAVWGATLSIGERDARVTLAEVSHFLRRLGSGNLPDATTKKLLAAMAACVERGTAKGAAPTLVGTKWRLAGKTGSGPTVGVTPPDQLDGWFAGLILDGDVPRYTIAVYIDHRGYGGGVAATLAAQLARELD